MGEGRGGELSGVFISPWYIERRGEGSGGQTSGGGGEEGDWGCVGRESAMFPCVSILEHRMSNPELL